MSKSSPLRYQFDAISARNPKFQVSVTGRDGITKVIGTVEDIYIRHMSRRGWEATGPDGHLAVHEHRWQAAWALTWDRKGAPPFPVSTSHEREVTAN